MVVVKLFVIRLCPSPTKLKKSPEIKTNKKVAVKWSVINFISEFWILFFRTGEANVDFDFNTCKHFLYISRFLKTWRLKKMGKTISRDEMFLRELRQ